MSRGKEVQITRTHYISVYMNVGGYNPNKKKKKKNGDKCKYPGIAAASIDHPKTPKTRHDSTK
jgi:hypothetical protein